MRGWMKAGMLVCAMCLIGAAGLAAEEGVTVLFDGKSLDAWTQKAQGGWTIDDEGCLAWQKGCGYIWTKEQFGNFVLDLDFKVSAGCNSGIFIRTAKTGNPVATGIEIQVLDSHAKEKPGKNDCCSVYDCLAPSKNAEKKPGEWNHVAITCNDNKIEVVLNGEKVIDMDLDQWTEAHKNPDGSKNKFGTAYKDMPRKGFIGLQDHGKPVWYRNVKITALKDEQALPQKGLRYDGLYQGSTGGGIHSFLRFYEDGAVRLLFAQSDSSEKANSAIGKGGPPVYIGTFKVSDSKIEISTKMALDKTDLKGRLVRGQLVLSIGEGGETAFKFVEMAGPK